MELRAKDERAVIVGHDGTAEREVDPHSLAIGADLSDSLHEWARVVDAIRRSETAAEDAGIVVTQRGRQLATQVAGAMGRAISYVDPISGEVSVIEPPTGPAPQPKRAHPPEPTPWLTGGAVSVVAAIFVSVAVIALATTLTETSVLLGVASNVVVTAGLLPSVWLARRVPILRWLAAGTAVGLAVGWIGLLFILFT